MSIPITSSCNICDGQGCVHCSNRGFTVKLDQQELLWSVTQASQLQIYTYHQALRTARNVVVFLIALAGIITLVVLLGQSIGNDQTVRELLFARHGSVLILWTGVLAACYGIFLVAQKRPTLQKLPPRAVIDLTPYINSEVRSALSIAGDLAVAEQHTSVTVTHLFWGLLGSRTMQNFMVRLGITTTTLTAATEKVLFALPTTPHALSLLDSQVFGVLAEAFKAAQAAGQERVTTPDVLQAIIHHDPTLSAMLEELGVPRQLFRDALRWLRAVDDTARQYSVLRSRSRYKPKTINRALTARVTPLLDRFSDDLTRIAKNGGVLPAIGRESELEAVMNTLGRSDGNVILVGEPGVGKSAIIDALALLMASENVPESLRDRRLVRLDLPALLGVGPEVAPVVAQIMNEAVRSGNIILVLENITEALGGAQEGTLDVAALLAPLLESPRIGMIATALPLQYSDRLERQRPDFVRRFQKIVIEEPALQKTMRILGSHVALIEHATGVVFSYQAVLAAVELSTQYIADRYLPGKAITVLEETAQQVRATRGKSALVVVDDIAASISAKTTIAIQAPGAIEKDLLLHLEDEIHKYFVDQDEAVFAVADALRRSRAGFRSQTRPIANLLFLGPTGVGKTELAKTIARIYFGGEEKMLRLDMSEYQTADSIYNLIGSPQGSGQQLGHLTELVRQRPYTVLLLDEVEKAHKSVRTLFLQIMDDGRVTDSTGRMVRFTNVIVIATSNVGAARIAEDLQKNAPYETMKSHILNQELAGVFAPEFINRFDQICIFHPLGETQTQAITKLLLNEVTKDLAEKGIQFTADDAAIAALAQRGTDTTFGARALRRTVQDQVISQAARLVLAGKVQRRDTIKLRADGTLEVIAAQRVL